MIKIRKATKKDVETLYNLIIEIAKYHNQEEFIITDTNKMLNAGFGDYPRFGALLAEYDNKVVGYLSYTWNYSIWGGSEYMNLDDLFVLKDYRSHKVGFYLMEKAKEICIEKNINLICWEVESDNQKAIDFYNRIGATMKEKGLFKWNF
ncbi:GNAT family N-acetyltransferase [Aureivirga marina]|uniref:GNAT family N-acetyltransferase n=1 Tax=Aureivirga marina TaxID=1182451 RepID=UPI0018C952EF|nr:GNAT family N-acetyltransferase [Aureivirga marina]